ncbi:MAG: hypothetical protein Q8919_10270 [Bacteroidota bacterium]|nr:hypothetical protein [Bacteroidota bacterium]
MKHPSRLLSIFVLALLILFGGCIVEYNPNAGLPQGDQLQKLTWTPDGMKVIVQTDSFAGSAYMQRIRLFDQSAALVQSFDVPIGNAFQGDIWPTADDSTIFASIYTGSLYTVSRYFLASGSRTAIAGGAVYGESVDHRHLFIGPSGYQSQSGKYLVVDAGSEKPRLESSWLDVAPSQYTTGAWIGASNLGYFRYNSFNLVDFVITDSLGTKLDSFDVSFLTQYYNTQAFHGPGALYITGRDGVLKYDSASRTHSFLTTDNISQADISPDGSFIVYAAGLSTYTLTVLNTKTGATKQLASNYVVYPKISPSGDHLAYIDKSGTSGGKLVVMPISAP